MKKVLPLLLFLALIYLPCSGQNLDIRILRSINEHRPLSQQPTFLFLSNSVYPICIATPLTFVIAGKLSGNQTMFRNGLASGAALCINAGMTEVLKYSVNRKRPYIRYPDLSPQTHDSDPSFPSGHTSNAFCTATSLSLMFPKWYVIIPSYAWASAVGYSRLYLGMHYPSDVLAGALLGIGSAVITFKLKQWIEKQYIKK